MNILGPIAGILLSLLSLYMLVLLVRVIFDFIQIFSRDYRPSGVVLVLANVVYSLTDPPLRLIRRFVPSLQMGGVGIDLSFLVLYAAIIVIQMLLGALVR